MNGQLGAANDDNCAQLDVERQIATAARQARHRKRLLAIYGPGTLHEEHAVDASAEARIALRALAQKMNGFDFRLLVAVAHGVKLAVIAERVSLSSSAVRQRVSRARRANAWAAA